MSKAIERYENSEFIILNRNENIIILVHTQNINPS